MPHGRARCQLATLICRRARLSEVRRLSGVKRGKVQVLTEASEYRGQAAVAVSCTQLGTEYTSSRAKRIVDEWIELLGSPIPLSDLQFTTRTPKRLFAALAGSHN